MFLGSRFIVLVYSDTKLFIIVTLVPTFVDVRFQINCNDFSSEVGMWLFNSVKKISNQWPVL
jgi:hypothetical protein